MPTIAPTLAGRMLCASGLAYSVPDNGPLNTEPYYTGAGYAAPPAAIASDANNANAACTIGMNQDGIILAFRGTVFTSIGDWINDLLVKLVPVSGITGNVHDGFNNAVSAINSPVVSAIQQLQSQNPNAPLYITGHSKGAGMGPIAAAYLAMSGIKVSGLYLFAPPLPGDATFANAFNSSFPNTFLYENYQDIVPVLPPTAASALELDAAFIKLGTAEAIAAAIAITAIGAQGYHAVGSLSNTFYIPQPVNGAYSLEPMTTSLVQQQMNAIKAAIIAGDFSVFENAHSHACGFGYMSAVCPSVCQ